MSVNKTESTIITVLTCRSRIKEVNSIYFFAQNNPIDAIKTLLVLSVSQNVHCFT